MLVPHACMHYDYVIAHAASHSAGRTVRIRYYVAEEAYILSISIERAHITHYFFHFLFTAYGHAHQ